MSFEKQKRTKGYSQKTTTVYLKTLSKLRMTPRGGKSGKFNEVNSQKIFSKIRFDRKYLGKHHGIGSFANQNSSVMANSN